MSKMDSTKKEFKRLPQTVVPLNYDILIKPDLINFTFDGNETILIDVKEQVNQIYLNAFEVNITEASIKINGKDVLKAEIQLLKEDELAMLSFGSSIPTGHAELAIVFSGTLNDKLKGFYRSKYLDANEQERYAGVTHFEPTGARMAFPCWDEPVYRATFDITLIVPKNHVALSNMNMINETLVGDNLRQVKFAKTPIMSTYLVAFIVGEFDYVETKSSDNVLVRVYTPVNKKEQGLFALEVAAKALPFYKDYFKIAYSLPKIDLIAIPDFAIGAMENWGLVTYRETCLLVDTKNTSSERKQWIALVVTHELAHMWFGNLVTMEWWTHLWLKEGFASFIEFLCVDHLFSEYDIWTQFVTDVYTRALDLDALHNSHPIEVPVGHPSEITEIFDDISYNKGASIIRMLHQFIGDDAFRKGLNLYLSRHAYKNTLTEDLWVALQEASQKQVGNVMSTWTKQKGFPVIKVSSVQDGDSLILTLTQEKFCADGQLPPSEANILWMIPLSISTSANPKALETLFESRSIELRIYNVTSNQWVKLNPGTVGFYRVQYSPEMLNSLLPAIKDKTLPALDRLGLQNDLFAMVQAGRTSTVEILKLLQAFSDEDNYIVWSSINACLGKLNLILSHTDSQPLFHNFGRQLLTKTYSKLGWQPVSGESHLDTLLRNMIISRLATFEDPLVLSEAKKRFEAHCNGTHVIPADLRSAVYRSVAIDCDDKTFDFLFKIYRETDLHEEKNRILHALGLIKEENKIKNILDFALSDEVRSQDIIFIIASVASTKKGRDFAWNFFKQNKDELKRRYEGSVLMGRIVKCLTENFASVEKAQEIKEFFNEHKFPSAERTVKQSLETICLNKEWLTRDKVLIERYLLENISQNQV